MDPNTHQHVGPLPMAENARLFSAQRKEIFKKTNVTVSCRPTRPQWQEKVKGAPRSLCLAGPRCNMDEAYEISTAAVTENIRKIEAGETPPDDDSGDDLFPVPSAKKRNKHNKNPEVGAASSAAADDAATYAADGDGSSVHGGVNGSTASHDEYDADVSTDAFRDATYADASDASHADAPGAGTPHADAPDPSDGVPASCLEATR